VSCEVTYTTSLAVPVPHRVWPVEPVQKRKHWSVSLSSNGGLLQVTTILFLRLRNGAVRNWWERASATLQTLRFPEALDLAEVACVALLGESVLKGRNVSRHPFAI
jgi:hypothetical protein